jgi:hypothetical protein
LVLGAAACRKDERRRNVGKPRDFSAVLDLRPKPATRGKITAGALINRTIAAETT